MNLKVVALFGAVAFLAAPVPMALSQESCITYMETVKEKFETSSAEAQENAKEHMEAAEKEAAENNEQGCMEKLEMAMQELGG